MNPSLTNQTQVKDKNLYEYNAGSEDYNSPYRFNGKELDPETGNYYYGARYYDPKISVWLSVDPLAHKYPSLSPYVFTGNNPIMLVDPDGRDIWELDLNGNVLNHTVDESQDTFIVLDNDGNYVSGISFEGGTIEAYRNQTTSFNDFHSGGKEVVGDIDINKIRGDFESEALFTFMADNTNVEWNEIKTGESGGSGLGFLTTGHREGQNPGLNDLLRGQLINDYTIREINHNHPKGSSYPSGSFNAEINGQMLGAGEWGDVKTAANIQDWYNRAYPNRSGIIEFNVYTTKNGFKAYDRNTRR